MNRNYYERWGVLGRLKGREFRILMSMVQSDVSLPEFFRYADHYDECEACQRFISAIRVACDEINWPLTNLPDGRPCFQDEYEDYMYGNPQF